MANPVTKLGQTFNASEQQSLVSVTVDGIGNLGVFDMRTGGDPTAPSNKYRSGGMGPQRSYLGLAEYSDITVTRVYDEGRDVPLAALLATQVGRIYVNIAEQPLDQDANPYGPPTTWRGRLVGVTTGQSNANSNTVRTWEIHCNVETRSG